jgi:hypothetical protein
MVVKARGASAASLVGTTPKADEVAMEDDE